MAISGSRLNVSACYTRLCSFWNVGLWQEEAGGLKGFLQKSLRVFVLALKGLIQNRSLIRASALAYLTGLAIVPILALLFAILKSLGIQRLLAAPLMEHLAPGSKEFALQILHYIESTQVASLGVFGIVALLADLIILMTNVERAFNDTWQISRTRPWRRKLSDYLSIFLIFPLLMAVAISIATNFLSHPLILPWLEKFLPSGLLSTTSGLFSLGIFWLAFTFIYLVMPNTRVKLVSALLGGLVGALFWEIAQVLLAWIHAKASYYNAIYGVVYHLLFFTLWLYWSWLIVLFGMEVAYAHQNLEPLSERLRRPQVLREPVDEYIALAALVAIADRFLRRQPPLGLEELTKSLASRNILALRVMETLKDLHLVLEVSSRPVTGPARYVPAMPLDEITVGDILRALREARLGAVTQVMSGEPGLTRLVRHLAESCGTSPWDALSLKELVLRLSPEPAMSAS
jgi:membrane protein|uniref:YihY/virulence factor BrkB family protein n=1 Tax=Desulfobacca acetoxidans TaxID=60893 RepID=A0A7V6A4B5_9BACT